LRLKLQLLQKRVFHHQQEHPVNDEYHQSGFSEAAEQHSSIRQQAWRREQLGIVVLDS
jgi:hypothetical protein